MNSNLIDPVEELLRRYGELVTLWNEADGHIKSWQQRQGQIQAQAQDLAVAARVFSFDLFAEYQRREAERILQLGEGADPAEVAAKPAIPDTPRTIKDIILEAARKAHPKPVRVVELRKQLATQGIATHQKTCGMTLYRLSREGAIRREKQEWYFVPENERGRENSGANTPEVFGATR